MPGRALETETWEMLEPQVKTLWRVENLISTLIIALMVGVPEFLITRRLDNWRVPPLTITGGLLVLSLGIGQWIVGRTYHLYRFRLGEDDLAVAKGVFWRSWRFVSRNRIQHVDISAGPIARALGLVNVSLFVGGMPTAAVSIPGLTEARGEQLRATLIKDTPKQATDEPIAPMVAPSDSDPQLPDLPPSPIAGTAWQPPGLEGLAEIPTAPPANDTPPQEPR